MRVGRSFAGIVALATLLGPWTVAAGDPARPPATPATGPLDEVVARRMSEAGIVGLGAAIIVDRKVVWTKGYGFADRERRVPFTPDTVMNAGSIAKTFLGVAMMQAVREGRLSLDDAVDVHLPFRVINPHHPGARITLRHLATHTSGITDRREVYSRTYHYGGDSPEPLGEYLAQYLARDGAHYSPANFIDAKPGARREYSNIGAALAGHVVERAVGRPLNVYTRERIFAPLRMTRTGWFLSEVDLANHSRLYVSQNGHVVPIPLYGSTTYPDGGVRTSVADLSRFFIALLDGGQYEGARILDADGAAEMLRFQFTEANRPENYPAAAGNSGLFWRTKFNGTRIGHGGSDPGIQTEMLSDLARETGVVLFVNTSLGGPDQAAAAAIFDALWNHAVALRKAAASSTE